MQVGLPTFKTKSLGLLSCRTRRQLVTANTAEIINAGQHYTEEHYPDNEHHVIIVSAHIATVIFNSILNFVIRRELFIVRRDWLTSCVAGTLIRRECIVSLMYGISSL